MARSSSTRSGKGKWSAEEHRLFEEGVSLVGWGKWMKIAEMIPTRNKTQVKSHAQKVKKRTQREEQSATTTPPLTTKAAPKTRNKPAKGERQGKDIQGITDESKKIHLHDASNMNIAPDQDFDILFGLLSSCDSNASKNVSSHPKSKMVTMEEIAALNSSWSDSSKTVSSHGEGAAFPNIDPANEEAIDIPALNSMPSGSSKTVSFHFDGFTAPDLDVMGEEMDKIPTVLHALKHGNSTAPRVVDLMERGFTFSNVDVTGEEAVGIPTALNALKRENSDDVDSLEVIDEAEELSFPRMTQSGSPPISSGEQGQGTSDEDMDIDDYTFKDTFRGFPSNYDVLCGDERECSEHIGNRRFRVMIKMRLHRYEPYFVATFLPSVVGDRENRMREFFDDVLEALSACRPPCRFLVPLDTTATVGMWGVLDDVGARRRIREAFNQCMIESVGVPV